MTPDGGRLEVLADLSIEVDGAPVRVESAGSRVRVVTEDVRGFVDHLRAAARATGSASARGSVATVAEALAAEGITGVLAAPTGEVAVLGADVDSPVGRLLWGTRRVRVDAVRLLRSSEAARWGLTGAGLVLGALVVVRLRRR
jgi:hypothetical protein